MMAKTPVTRADVVFGTHRDNMAEPVETRGDERHELLAVDTNNDGAVDVLAIDTDGNGQGRPVPARQR